MKLKPYPKYKNSGVEWLGEVPEGWKLKKIIEKYRGDNQVYLHLQTVHHGEVVISPTCKVNSRKEMEVEIKKLLGEESIRLKVGGEGSK